MARNHRKGIADLTATSSKDLFFKLRNFEVNRAKIAEERQNYGMQEVCSSPAQYEGKEGEIATTGINKPLTRLTSTQGKLKEGDFGTKGMTKKDNLDEMGIDSKKQMIASNSKCKEGQHLPPKRIKTSVPKNLDFSFLQSTFDAIRGKANNMPPTVGQQRSILPEQPGSSKMNKNQGPQGEASGAAMNVTDSTKRDSTDVLQRKLDAIHKRNNTVLSTSVTQQRSLENSAQSAGYQGQHNNVQLTQERIQKRQEEFPLPSSESEPEPEGDMRDDNGPELGKGNIVVRATTIDEFLKEHGIDVDLDGISIGEQTTEQLDDSEDSEALYQNYYQHVMAESDDEEVHCKPGHAKKKKTRGHTSCADIYGKTMEQREEVTFELGGPVGPTAKSVSNLTSFAGTLGRNKRFVSLLYTNCHVVPQKSKKFMWKYINTKFILPASAEKWVIQTIWDAWKRFKTKLKQKTQQQQQSEEIYGLQSLVKQLLLWTEPNMRPEEVDAMLQHAHNSPIDANSGHGSHHV